MHIHINSHSIVVYDGRDILYQIKQKHVKEATVFYDTELVRLNNEEDEIFDIEWSKMKSVNQYRFDDSILSTLSWGILEDASDKTFAGFVNYLRDQIMHTLQSFGGNKSSSGDSSSDNLESTNSTSNTLNFTSVPGIFHGTFDSPLSGALVINRENIVNGANVSVWYQDSSLSILGGDLFVRGNTELDPLGVTLVSITYDENSNTFITTTSIGTTVEADTTSPGLISSIVNGSEPDEIRLTFTEPVTATNLGFNLSSGTITSITGSGTNVLILTRDTEFAVSELVTLTYDNTLGDVADESLNKFDSITTARDIINNVGVISWYALYDAAESNITKDVSDNITQLNDISGNGNHLTTFTGTPTWISNGINNVPAIVLDGLSDFRRNDFVQGALDLSQDLTIVIVFQITNLVGAGVGAYHTLIALGVESLGDNITTFGNIGNEFTQIYSLGNSNEINSNYDGIDNDGAVTISNQLGAHYAILRKNGTDSRLSINGGAEVISTGTSTSTLKNLILGRLFNADEATPVAGAIANICEFGIAPRIGDIEFTELKSMLSTKYGI